MVVEGVEGEFVDVSAKDVELEDIDVAEVEVMVVELIGIVRMAVETGAVEMVRIAGDMVMGTDVPVLLLTVEVAFTPVEVGSAVLVELVIEGTVAFVLPLLPEVQDIFKEGKAA